MKRVTINICTSQTCATEGALLFKQLDAMMSPYLKTKVAFKGTDCPGYCKACGTSKSPCAVINNHPVPNTTASEIMKISLQNLDKPS